MFKHILVPTGLSGQENHALDIAVKLCAMDGGTISLLHVIEIIANTTFEEFSDFYRKLEKKAHAGLNRMIDGVKDADTDILPEVIYGNRAREILRFVEEREIDLIVMKSHRIDAEDRAQGWGTISYKVGILAPCPVMLVK
ncbi:MAG: universal stress protein [Deltaproteobacteria bacterium]|nr:universal stress protein [Deltaproteobacteria bacterium]